MLIKIDAAMRVTSCTFLSKKDLEKFGSNPNFSKVFEPTTLDVSPSEVLAIAIRHGVAVADGLAVDAWPVLAQRRPAELRHLIEEGQRLAARIKPQTDFVDEIIGAPGLTDQVNAKADASMEAEAARADTEAAKYLEATVQSELLDHWRSLGGQSTF